MEMQHGKRRTVRSIGKAIAAVSVAASSLLGTALGAEPARPAGRPNVVLIVADDLGYGDPGCYGGTLVPTPAIDSLARGGIRCTDGYVTSPVCAPSRCGILTGAYNQRFGMQWNEDRARYRTAGHVLLPQALKAAGYATGHIGKWNVGADIKGCFDKTYDVIDWEADYLPREDGKYVGADDPKKVDSGKVQGVWGPERPGEEYLTDRLGRHAVEFIDHHKDRPFFLYLAFNAVHSPFHGKAADQQRFAHLAPPMNHYASMLASLDENVGRVLSSLDANGLAGNTMVVFVSDNGPAKGPVATWPADWPKGTIIGSTGGLAGHKAQYTEGGIRVPYIVRWPGKLKAGDVYRSPVSTMDLYPTFCAAVGAAVPEGTRVDGVDLMPYFTGERSGDPHEILFWKSDDRGAVRKGNYKLVIHNWTPKPHLFDLAADVGEQNNLAASKPEIVQELRKALDEWSAPMPPRANPQPVKPTATRPGPAK